MGSRRYKTPKFYVLKIYFKYQIYKQLRKIKCNTRYVSDLNFWGYLLPGLEKKNRKICTKIN